MDYSFRALIHAAYPRAWGLIDGDKMSSQRTLREIINKIHTRMELLGVDIAYPEEGADLAKWLAAIEDFLELKAKGRLPKWEL